MAHPFPSEVAMPLMNWDPSFETGNATVDEEHQGLVRMVNEFHDTAFKAPGKADVGTVLGRLASYTVEHFAHEEKLMRDTQYPDYANHKKEHDQLVAKATELIKGHQAGKMVLTVTVSQFLQEWLRVHILQVDKRMIKYVKEQHKKAA
jgi:hemerythrin-like metal-binding protein